MSYILEALKKAEAERQLGSAPTIHAAPAVHAAPAAAGSRKPLLIGLAAGVLLASAALFAAWRHQAPVAPAGTVAGPGAAQVVAPAPETAPEPPVAAAVGSAPAAPIVPAAEPARAGQIVASVEPAPAAPVLPASRPAPVAPAARMPAPHAPVAEVHPRASALARVDTPAPDAPARADSRQSVQASAPAPGARAAPRLAASGADDNVRPLAELPEAIQREVPRVAFGGYIYSPNPADRLLLVDKALRHEGEEVAPGLVLEKLLPKAAVMNYRGYRYRVAY